MGLGSIIGTGVFVSLGIAAGVVGSGVVLAVALAAMVATANGLSSAQLAAAHPVSGGTYEYGHHFVNSTAGFAAGWMFMAAKSASAATAALGFAGYLLHALGFSGGHWTHVGVALGLVVVITLLVLGGIRRSNTANIAIVSLTMLALASFIVFGALSIDLSQVHERLVTEVTVDAFASPTALLEATALMFVAYTGYGRIATLGEEMREPERNIPRAIITTLVITMLLYVVVAAVAVAAAGAEGFAEATRAAAAPLEVVARGFEHPWVAGVVAIGAVTAMAGVLLNLVLGLSRVLLAMARRREVPKGLDHINTRTSSPDRSVLVVGAIIAGLVLLGDVKTTWSFSAFTVLVYYGITNLSALLLPEKSRRFPRLIAVAGLVSCFGLAFFVELEIWLSGIALLVAGFVFRAVIMRLQGGKDA
jgi:APA family basic amino acid/polyamine antiporter